MKTTLEAEFSLGTGLAYRTIGRIARAAGELVESKAHFANAIKTFASIPAQFELARTHVDMATLANSQNDPDLTRVHYEDAIRLFNRLRLRSHAERTRDLVSESGLTPPMLFSVQKPTKATRGRQ